MSKINLVLTLCIVLCATATAQNPNCLGLKNPTNFTLTGGTAQSKWTGYIGSKDQSQSSCTSIGSTFQSTPVSAANLLTTVDGSSESCGSTSSLDLNGNSDYLRRFSIKGSGNDILTNNNLSYLPPDSTFTSSIRIGSYCANGKAEELTYEFNVNNDNQLVTIWYAMSLYDARHATSAENPEFVITVEKNTGTASNPNWQLASGDTLCYIRASPVTNASLAPFLQGGSSNVYLPWNKVIINLSRLLYQQVRIKIAAGDCCYNAHYGYCYVAGECQPMRLTANGCAAGETDNVAGIKAPSGAISYEWYRSLHGKLSGSARTTQSNYALIPGQTSDSLSVVINHFITSDNDTATETTFMCKMTTKMNESLSIVSPLYADAGNKKPTFAVDSLLACDASITLRDISHTPFATSDSDNVDTNLTQWKFYNTPQPTPVSLVGSLTGGTVNYQYLEAGFYSARVRTYAYDTSCWNEKTVTFRTVLAPRPRVRLERNNLCKGDTIGLFDETQGSTFRQWIIHRPEGDTVLTPFTQAIRFRFDTTTRITLRTRNNTSFVADTNGDGLVEDVYCYAEFDTTIFVEEYPKLIVTGDTIVCNGTQAIVNVTSQIDETQYDWYTSMSSNNPLQQNSATLTTMPIHNTRYYVQATSPFGCKSWDSINIYIVDPVLTVPVTEVCDNTPVRLYASNAYSFSWTSMPDDPTLSGQESNDSIIVTPHQTTTYSLVGHGMNNCSTTPLTQTVTVFPFPVPAIEMSPKFIDSEKPTITFRDVSEGATTSLWDFGNGNTSTERQIRYTFTDLSQDSILISLTTGNDLNCTSDTSFYVPVELFSVWFPNAFTPTLTTNKTFKVFTHNKLEYYSLYIYNRNGQLVFYSIDQNEEWDGTYKGKLCPQGTYVYTCTYRRPGTTDIVNDHGTVVLLK